MSFYAVANGRNIGVFHSWNECNESVKGFPNAKYKKFKTKEECDHFIEEYNGNVTTKQPSITGFFSPSIPSSEFIPDYYVYTDGACKKNGKPDACAGIGVFFADNDSRNVSATIEGKQTNNTAEIKGFITACRIIKDDVESGKKVTIMTDSTYVMQCVSTYGEKCDKKSWDIDIPNKELVKEAYLIVKKLPNIHLHHVKAHTNKNDIHSYGNEQADKLANKAIGLDTCPYAYLDKKIYLNVPFTKKEDIKELGGKWDSTKKKWFIYDNNPHKSVIVGKYEIQ